MVKISTTKITDRLSSFVRTHGPAFSGKKLIEGFYFQESLCSKNVHEYFPRFYILGTLMKIKTGSTIFYFPPTALKLAFCKVKKEFAEENGIRPKAPAPVRTPVQTPFQTPGTTETTILV